MHAIIMGIRADPYSGAQPAGALIDMLWKVVDLQFECFEKNSAPENMIIPHTLNIKDMA